MQKKKIVLVLGMHRSGTSCLAGSLQQQGVYLGEVHEWNPHNLKGNRENPLVMQLNEDLLAFNQASWDRPNHPIQWQAEHSKRRDELISHLSQCTNHSWGFKDPRTLINLDFWVAGLAKFGSIHCIGTFRHPLAVAQSLHKRNGTPLEEGLALWYFYNQRLINAWEKQAFPVLSFDVHADIYSQHLQRALQVLELPYQIAEQPFFEKQLRSHQDMEFADSSLLLDKYLDCYQALQNIHMSSLQ